MGAAIAIDAMGGDNAPDAIVRGAVAAARSLPQAEMILVGDEAMIRETLLPKNEGKGKPVAGVSFPDNVRIVHTSERIDMSDPPSVVFRKKKNSSLGIAAHLVSAGEAQAFFSAGNSGACMAAAIHHLRTIEGIDRPAIATILPNATGRMILLDAGANVDCDEHNLLEFALMGSAYASKVMGKARPAVGLVSIGEEEGKGNGLTKSAASILKLMPINFIGNIEGTHIYTGKADVVVCDGFVGNVILKTSEGAAEYLQGLIRAEAMRSFATRLGGLLMKPAFRRVRRTADYAEVGGAPLLGVRGGCVIGHGRSNELAVLNGIRQAARTISHDLVPEIERLIQQSKSVTSCKIQAL
jgi:glycerol-3-phosphate acyltransferase PlsX